MAAAKKKTAEYVETKEAPVRRGRKPDMDLGTKLKVLVKENPKRAGSESASRFDLYTGCKTVQDYLDKGGRLADVKWDTEKSYIQLG